MGPNGTLCCSGESKHGLLNGNGRSYSLETSTLLYNGEWKHGLRHGYGIEYVMGENGQDRLVYQGEWKRGMRHGDGKLFDESGNLIYEGSLAYNLYEGIGREYRNGAVVYEGSFRRGMAHGEGKYLDYVGEFRFGLRWGYGSDTNFTGVWIAGKPNNGILTQAVKNRRKRKLIVKSEAESELIRSGGSKKQK